MLFNFSDNEAAAAAQLGSPANGRWENYMTVEVRGTESNRSRLRVRLERNKTLHGAKDFDKKRTNKTK